MITDNKMIRYCMYDGNQQYVLPDKDGGDCHTYFCLKCHLDGRWEK